MTLMRPTLWAMDVARSEHDSAIRNAAYHEARGARDAATFYAQQCERYRLLRFGMRRRILYALAVACPDFSAHLTPPSRTTP